MEILHRTLVDLGLSVFRVPVDAFVPPDLARITPLLADLRAFRPELALGLCAGNYALICRLPAGRDGWRPNVFTEVLGIPTVCLWEHAPLEIADQVLAPLPDRPEDSEPGADDALRRMLTHGRLLHWSRDSGLTRIMGELGYASPDVVIQADPTLALPVGASPGSVARGEPSVAFVGHVYQDLPPYAAPELEALAADAIREWAGDLRSALWDVLARTIAALPADVRRRLALERDQTFFWRFVHRTIVRQAQTFVRLHLLGGAGVPVACYGNVDPGGAGVPGNLRPMPGHIPYGADVAAVLARHPITIDVQNPGAVNGFSEKPILGFSAGGFVLVDRKQDWVDTFGALGEAVSYMDADDLAGKVDLFLSNPRFRHEIADAMREEIGTRHRLDDLLAEVIERAVALSRASRAVDTSTAGAEGPVTVVRDLLPDLSSDAGWSGASVEHTPDGAVVQTAALAWAYAAAIAVPQAAASLREPHLRLRLSVESGRVGIALMQTSTGKLLAEQVVSAGPQAIPLTVELPRAEALTLIVRNTVDTRSRAVLTEATLCDRPVPIDHA
jgi:hypothetical protein